MTAPVYGVSAPANVALVAATPKTVLAVLAGASFGLEAVSLDLGSLGVTASEVPMVVELCSWDGTGAGTSTAATIAQLQGLTIPAGFTAFYNYTAEPTTLALLRRFTLTPNSATLLLPLDGEEFQAVPTDGFAIRLTAPANTSVAPSMRVRRI